MLIGQLIRFVIVQVTAEGEKQKDIQNEGKIKHQELPPFHPLLQALCCNLEDGLPVAAAHKACVRNSKQYRGQQAFTV